MVHIDSCCEYIHIGMLSSCHGCAFDRHIGMLSSSCDSSCEFDRHIGMLSSCHGCSFDRHIGMLSSSCDSSCEFDRHIGMLSSSCEFDRHIGNDIIIIRYGEQKIAQFRTHYLTKERSYVSTQKSGYFSIDTEMI